MSEEDNSKYMRNKTNGVNVGGNFTQGNNYGQNATGSRISQKMEISPSAVDLEQLRKNLLVFREELAKLDLSSENQEIIKNDVNAALIEARKEEPKTQKVKARVESVFETLKDAGKTVKNVTEVCGSLKTVINLLGITL
jgi:hypothetical protein